MIKEMYALPGTMCNEKLWRELEQELPTGIQLKPITLPKRDNLIDIVNDVVELLPNAPVNLLGFSLGGYLASLLTTMYPDKIASLMVISNSPCALNDMELKAREMTIHWLNNFPYSGITRAKAQSMLDTSNQNEQWIQRIIDMDAELGKDTLLQQLTATTKRTDLSKSLAAVNIPKHFIASEEDPLVRIKWLTDYISKDRRAAFTCIAGRGHMLPMEQARKLAHIIEGSL
jgi:pimeloyl-ACP methyl ester carboxylesterase